MTELEQINQIVTDANRIVIIQADNPDADSLASSLALEAILHEMGKEPVMYCGIDMPEYLKYLPGWDRVVHDMPNQFDACIIVDTSTLSLLTKMQDAGVQGWVASKPVIVLDHHASTDNDISFARVILNDHSKVSTGELIYEIATELQWPLPLPALEHITTSILADSLGLTTENTTAQTYRVMAELIEKGVSRTKLEDLRRSFSRMPETIFRYKATLISRTELLLDGKLALITIPQNEINEFSPLYNPNALIQNEHLQTKDVLVSVSMKSYDDGRITASIRCNQGAPIAAELAKHFGGGGHDYAAGFKLENKLLQDIKTDCVRRLASLLSERENTES